MIYLKGETTNPIDNDDDDDDDVLCCFVLGVACPVCVRAWLVVLVCVLFLILLFMYNKHVVNYAFNLIVN